MRLLVIGGTSFVGRHAVEAAVDQGHDVAVFHRGRTNADLLTGRIDHRIGDRNGPDYSALDTDETWDAVLDRYEALLERTARARPPAIGVS